VNVFENIGGAVVRNFAYMGGLSEQFLSGVRALPRVLPVLGNRGRWQAAIRQMGAIGVAALPMIAIMAASTGMILALQGGAELRRFGALRYVIDLVAIGFTRELGPLLTAIVVSGRSGSAFSAEIGTMVVTSEIDALRTMALDPIEFVLAPKYLAAIVMVPCLTIMCSVFGILAGAGFMYLSTKMALGIYVKYVFDSIFLHDILGGLLKSVAFATIIVHVGCMEGFKVRGGPEAVGRSTTSAVVRSTFLVILADLLFTALFYLARLQ
jgi:phospholipid/cholesterol/gamma-HCH transport system permease protein